LSLTEKWKAKIAENAKAAAAKLEETAKKKKLFGESCLGTFMKKPSWEERWEFLVGMVDQTIHRETAESIQTEDERKEQPCRYK